MAVYSCIPGFHGVSHLALHMGAAISVWRFCWAHVEDGDADDEGLDLAEAEERQRRIALWGKVLEREVDSGREAAELEVEAASPLPPSSPIRSPKTMFSPGTPRGAGGRRRLGSFY